MVMLFVLCLAPPNTSSGALSVLRNSQGGEYVGVLRECFSRASDRSVTGLEVSANASLQGNVLLHLVIHGSAVSVARCAPSLV